MKHTTWNKDWRKSVIIISGGFDPVHKGHLRPFYVKGTKVGDKIGVLFDMINGALSFKINKERFKIAY